MAMHTFSYSATKSTYGSHSQKRDILQSSIISNHEQCHMPKTRKGLPLLLTQVNFGPTSHLQIMIFTEQHEVPAPNALDLRDCSFGTCYENMIIQLPGGGGYHLG